MEKLYFGDIEEFAEFFMDSFCEIPGGINVVADYWTIRDLLKTLVAEYEAETYDILLRDPDVSGYNREYLLFMDYDGYIYVAPVYTGNGYISISENDLTFVHSDTNSAFVRANRELDMIEFEIGFEDDECDGDCEHCLHNESAVSNKVYTEESKHGLTQSWTDGNGSYYSRSFYSTNSEELKDVKDEWARFARSLQ